MGKAYVIAHPIIKDMDKFKEEYASKIDATVEAFGGTGKYEKISGNGFSSRQNLKGKEGFAHSMNQMSGEYTY